MPKEATHISFADRIGKKLESGIRSEIAGSLDIFRLGSIFPDTFYYSKIEKVIEVSDYIHGKDGNLTNELILDFLKRLKNNHDSRGFSFIAGFITHCCLDIVFHPVVYYFSGNYYDKDNSERLRARYLHRHLETALVSQGEKSIALSNVIDFQGAIDFLEGNAFFEKLPVSDADISASLRRQFSTDSLFRNPIAYLFMRLSLKAGIIKGSDLLGLSFSNLSRDKRKLPQEMAYRDLVSGYSRKASLEELFFIAESNALSRIQAAFAYINGSIGIEECANIIKGESLDTGKEGVPIDDIRFVDPIK